MDRFDAMTIFIAAVDGGSLSAAARALGIPLPTVSRKVAELEAHLKTQLLVRTSRRLILTDAGNLYLAACRRILEDVQEAERAAAGEYHTPRGHLLLTAPMSFGRIHVEPVLLEFLKHYPLITARMVLADQFVNLFQEHIDVAIRIGTLTDSSLIAKRLGAVKWVTCASPLFIEKHGLPKTPDDLLALDCIVFDGLNSGATWDFRNGSKTLSLFIKPRLSVNLVDAAISAAVAGAGVTRALSYQTKSAEADGKLVRILEAFEPEPLPVHLLYPDHSFLPLKLRAFLDFAAPKLKQALTAVAAAVN
jgi:DNA-binding transcriptional LysR family regulator